MCQNCMYFQSHYILLKTFFFNSNFFKIMPNICCLGIRSIHTRKGSSLDYVDFLKKILLFRSPRKSKLNNMTDVNRRTGKSLSGALIFASTNPQYDDRLFNELQVQYMKIPSSNLGRTCCVQKLFLTFRTIFVHNMFSPCSAKRRASDKDLPA